MKEDTGDYLETAVRRLVKTVTEEVINEHIWQAKAQLELELRRKLTDAALLVSQQVQVDQMGHKVTITLDFPEDMLKSKGL